MSAARLAVLLALFTLLAVLVPVSGHGDMYLSAYNSSLALTDNANVYEAVGDGPTAILPNGLSGAPYGPLFYYPTATWLGALDRLGVINVDGWEPDTFDSILRDLPPTFLLKLPYLAAYVLTALALARTWRDGQGEAAALLWLFNPAVILFGLLMGQNDAWAFLASAVALLLGTRALASDTGRLRLSTAAVVVLALGAAVKLVPVLLVPPFALLLGRDWRERTTLAAAGFGVFAALLLPFAGTEFFREHGLFARQAGQASSEGIATAGVLYAAFLAALIAARQRLGCENDLLLLSLAFMAVHAVVYFLPDWNPQRSILMLGALATGVAVRRVFLLPYLLVTLYALSLTLERGGELGAGLLAPLTERVLNLPPLESALPADPLKSILFVAGGAAWIAALASVWWTRRQGEEEPTRWPFLLAPALLGCLVAYLVATFAMKGETAVTSFATPAPPVVVPAGETFAFAFFSPRDDVRAIEFNVLRGDTPADATVETGDGRPVVPPQEIVLKPGPNRIDVGYIEDAGQSLFRVSITPARPVEVEMREVPAALPVASAELARTPVFGTAAFTLRVETTREALLEDMSDRLRDEWKTLVSSLAVSGVALGAVLLSLRPRLPAGAVAAGP